MLVVCLHRDAPTQEAVVASGAFAVNILREGDDRLARRFATPQEDYRGRFGRLQIADDDRA
jgi:flavin reductase (DIM6/NTAB) family NADH-FMN oxidoreductase RutF